MSIRNHDTKNLSDDLLNLIEQSKNLYTQGVKISEIAKLLNKSTSSICMYLKTAKIQVKLGYRNDHFDESFFDDFDSPEKAYWLGFFLADGALSKRSLLCELQNQDKSHLEKFLSIVNSTSKLREYDRLNKRSNKMHKSVQMMICSTNLCNSLRNHGWVEFKKFGDIRILSLVSKSNKSHLIRGLFDGDGSLIIPKSGNNYRFTFVDKHFSVVQWFRDELSKIGLSSPKIHIPSPGKNAYVVRYGGMDQLRKIYDYLYLSDGPYLSRKRERFSMITSN